MWWVPKNTGILPWPLMRVWVPATGSHRLPTLQCMFYKQTQHAVVWHVLFVFSVLIVW
jgi:hypothetical protein